MDKDKKKLEVVKSGDIENVEIFTGSTGENDFDPDIFLQKAIGKLKNVIIIGVKKDDPDGPLYFTSSLSNYSKINWYIDRIKHWFVSSV